MKRAVSSGLAGLVIVWSVCAGGTAWADRRGNRVTIPGGSTLDLEVDLQATYDEMSQVYAPAMLDSDVALFRDILYTPDWVYVDASGKKLTRAEALAREVEQGPADSLIQRIEKLAMVSPDMASATVAATSIRAIVDTAGRYGRRAGEPHTLTSVTIYRDVWVRDSTTGAWKMKSREQMATLKTRVDDPDSTW